jgi:hypothetical protein
LAVLYHSQYGVFEVIGIKGWSHLLQTIQKGTNGLFGQIGLYQRLFFERALQNIGQFTLEVLGYSLDKTFAVFL